MDPMVEFPTIGSIDFLRNSHMKMSGFLPNIDLGNIQIQGRSAHPYINNPVLFYG